MTVQVQKYRTEDKHSSYLIWDSSYFEKRGLFYTFALEANPSLLFFNVNLFFQGEGRG